MSFIGNHQKKINTVDYWEIFFPNFKIIDIKDMNT